MWEVEYEFFAGECKIKRTKNLLHAHNLVNTVEPPRSTKNTKSLIDVIIINNSNYTKPSVLIDLGLSEVLVVSYRN
jgi:hypothetical protein